MKKNSIFLCCVLLVQLLCACSGKKEELSEPVNYYYYNSQISYNSPAGVIQAEIREGAHLNGDTSAFLKSYLLGPKSDSFVSPIPAYVHLVSCDLEDGVADIVLSNQFSNLSGMKLSIACSAILMSLHDYAEVQMIRISAKDGQLDDKDALVFTLDDIVLLDAVSVEE